MGDASVQNAWIIYKKHNPDASQLNFRRAVAQTYLRKFQNLPRSTGRPSTYSSESKVAVDIRYDRTDHYIEFIPNNKRRRCAGNHTASSAVRIQCCKCNVGLCMQCFSSYHRKS
ncbi:hypothetical protein NQ314_021203 [Rhamnusium bicolor]|uniref:Uncharacterized protein n=1 Tax=Rhamnusium bicolor TaxID=1586634 RepID=A0AAV8WJN9_9CUCU|nr:hypothetical protein NQ314_021203 [Rhamnusium bicolor]